MDKIRCIAIDDEYLALKIITDYVERIPFLELAATSKSALGAIEILQERKIDILFLDIQMPEISGLDFLATLSEPPLVIITSAYQEYALKGFEYNVIDYLLKPIRFERFLKAVNKARDQLALQRLVTLPKGEKPGKDLPLDVTQPSADYCYLKSGYRSEKVFYSDILYVEGQREYIAIYTTKKKYTLLKSMRNMHEELSGYSFVRIHKSYLVALEKVDSYYGNTIEIGERKLPIGRSYKAEVLKRLRRM